MKTRFVLMASAALAIVCMPAAGQQPGGPAQPISLADAVRLAQQNSPTTVFARNTERGSEQSVRTSKAAFFPDLRLTASGGQRGGTQLIQGTPVPFSGLPWSYNRQISSTVTLFDGGQKWFQYRAAEAGLDRDFAGVVTARYAVALNVKQQYYNVLAARESEAAAQRQLDQAQQQLKVSAAKMAAGAATRADSLTAAIQVANAQLAILNADNQLLNANAFLTRLIASPVQVTAIESDTSEVAHVDIDEASLLAMALDGPTVKQSAASLYAAQASHKAATTPYLPQISASGSYGQTPVSSQNFNWGSGESTVATNLQFTLSYTLFNNFAREQALVNARIAEDNADVTLKDNRLAARQNLTSFLSNFRTAQAQVSLQILTIQAAEEALRVVQQRYNLGTAQLLDILQAQFTLDNARAGLISARLSARTAKANIEALIGRDLP